MSNFCLVSSSLKHFIPLLFASVALLGCGKSDELVERPPRPVIWQEAEIWSGETASTYVGRVEDAESPSLAFEVTGTITSMQVDRGDAFSRGDVLAQLNSRVYDLDVERADAAIRQVRAQLVNLETDYERKAALEGTGAISRAMIDAALSARDAARSTLGELEASKAQAEKRRSDTVLKAPSDGRVVRRLVEPGTTVSGGQPVLEISADDAPLQATFLVAETALARMSLGDEYRIDLPSLQRTVTGTVRELGQTAETSLTFPVALALPQYDAIRAGMAAELVFAGQDKQRQGDLFLLPKPAIQTAPSRTYVAELKGETVGFRDIELVEVRDEGVLVRGLTPGQRIVVRGTAQLKDGDKVVPLDAESRRFPE